MALFGEKYGDKVRVIRFGESVALCGGVHARATGCIGMVKILSESSVAAGVRRIEAVTGRATQDYLNGLEDRMQAIYEMFNGAPDVVLAVQRQQAESDTLRKRLDDYMQKSAMIMRDTMLNMAEDHNGIKIIRFVGDEHPDIYKNIVPYFRGKFADEKFVLIIGNVFEEKPSLTLFLSQPMVDAGFNAGKIIREAAKFIQGGGGGQPFMATAGGKNVNGLDEAMDKIVEMING